MLVVLCSCHFVCMPIPAWPVFPLGRLGPWPRWIQEKPAPSSKEFSPWTQTEPRLLAPMDKQSGPVPGAPQEPVLWRVASSEEKTAGTCLDRFSIFGACASCPSRALNLQYRILLLLMTLEEAIWGQLEWVFQTRGRTRVLQPACRRWLPAEWTWLVYLSVPSSLNYHTGSCLLSLISNLLPLRLSGTCHIQASAKGP